MPAILSTIVLPAVTEGPGALSRLLSAFCKGITRDLGPRTAIACLHDLDDRDLRDIRLAYFQIEAAAHGLITLSDRADEGRVTFAAAMELRRRQRAPIVEAAPWS
ncbi:hypothetical protein [Bradyrhizobium sp. 6(2017)]|uniref:hypothetical protein n=1 Tax=Bradyrhizobium sp. 6(2017) TaxID=1197460 RepID=UPI0013E17210|nr:hypothetical protein [Bradyrhizobium sp. 6(2017)]QIG94151.1 hypothetical protein G6P99_17785 [Bradyrhizobium sp. 6(2017)]